MAIHPIERITMPSREQFYRDYVIPRKPVIITNLFEHQPLARIDTLTKAREAFGDVALHVKTEYSSMAASGGAGGETMPFDEYLDFAAANPTTRRMCTEYATPARISAQYVLPPLCLQPERALEEKEILDLPRRWGDQDLLSNMFLANRGNYAHTHYDGDHRQVILYQVFGRKRVILFRPSCGGKLNVLDAFMQGFCNTYLENMTENEKLAFVDEADGYEAMLQPGEAVYMPMLIWHYLEYVDTGMSVNFRFGRNKYGRFLCVDNLHRDYYIQNVSAKMVLGDQYSETIETIQKTFVRQAESRTAKIREMRALFRRLCAEIAPEAEPEKHCPPEREEQQIAQIEAELESGVRYSGDMMRAAAVASATGPIGSSQNRVIQSRVRELAYPPGVFAKILYNRFGKSNLEALTKTEAALLIREFSSPGAIWNKTKAAAAAQI